MISSRRLAALSDCKRHDRNFIALGGSNGNNALKQSQEDQQREHGSLLDAYVLIEWKFTELCRSVNRVRSAHRAVRAMKSRGLFKA